MRALIRAALNERALERYVLTWLGDSKGVEMRFEPWALIRDNEANNLLPSMAAGATATFTSPLHLISIHIMHILPTNLLQDYPQFCLQSQLIRPT